MHHKRRRPKHQRAGCIACKPHKDERGKKIARRTELERLISTYDAMELGFRLRDM